MKIYRYLSLLVLFAIFLLAGLSAGRLFDVQSGETKTPTPVKPPSPELQVKSRPNQLQVEGGPDQEHPLAVFPIPEKDQPDETDAQPTGITPPIEVQPQSAKTAATASEPQPVVQKNLLIIGVDNLADDSPNLEGMWLVLYLAQTPEFTLMPIYPGAPAEDGKMRSQDYKLAKLYRADRTAFFAELEEQGIWWSGYFVVDRFALLKIARQVDLLSGEPVEGDNLQVDDVPPPWNDPQTATRQQARFTQALCDRTAHLSVDQIGELDDLFLLFSEHILSDIPREQAAAELVGMLVEGSPITCKFPSLAGESDTP